MDSSLQIDTYSFKINQLYEFLNQYFQSLDLGKEYVEDLLKKNLSQELAHLRSDLFVLVELPYVDKVYRDTYYHYYASRLKNYSRNTIRISFFDEEIIFENGLSSSLEDVKAKYLGFLILRPTFPKIIGRSAISPKALKNPAFKCCLANIPATAYMHKVSVNAFPHASQDGQALSCAETTIWSLLEYFGNKYAEYSPLLPSKIIQLLQKFSFKRQIPSDGLTAEQIAYVVREVGFGAMFYSISSHGTEFPMALGMFIESGIPVVGVLKSETIGHAVNIVGRKDENRKDLFKSISPIPSIGEKKLFDFNCVEREYVFIDDNLPPYQLAKIDDPCCNYEDTEWHSCSLATIIVPLYSKIYLDPLSARKNFLVMTESSLMAVPDNEPFVIRFFLASSRSYKAYLAQNKPYMTDSKLKKTE